MKRLTVASFDVGRKNFAQYIEDVNFDKVEELCEKYTSKNAEEILHELVMSSTRVSTGVFDLCSEQDENKYTLETRKKLIAHLENFRDTWAKCDVFIIEQQYFKIARRRASEGNVDAIKLAEGLMIWFMSEFPFKVVEMVSNSMKTRFFNAPKRLKDKERKTWAISKARDLYFQRGDKSMMELFLLSDRIFRKRLVKEEVIQKMLETLPPSVSQDIKILAEQLVRKRQKLDDISDAFLQCQAYVFKTFIVERYRKKKR